MWKYIIAAIGGLATAWVGKQIDFKGIVRKSEIESKDEIYTSWKEMYETKAADHNELKAEYNSVRQTVFDLEEKFSQLKFEMADLKRSMQEKEDGYLLQISQLEERVDELEEENASLKEELETFKGGGKFEQH
nr:MAG TPA: TPR/MLP1/MLP2-like protein [Caudoviricetes sp.]